MRRESFDEVKMEYVEAAAHTQHDSYCNTDHKDTP